MLTFLNELSPSLGPRSQLIAIRLFYLGTFLQAAHEVIAEPMAVINSLDGTFVVPHLRAQKQIGYTIFFYNGILATK